MKGTIYYIAQSRGVKVSLTKQQMCCYISAKKWTTVGGGIRFVVAKILGSLMLLPLQKWPKMKYLKPQF